MPAQSNAPRRRSSAPIPITRERALMDLAKANAERDRDKPRRPLWVTIAALLLSVVIVVTVGRGFDLFLTGFQRLLERIAQEEARQEASKPQPIFVVPPEQSSPSPAENLVPAPADEAAPTTAED